jgi:hypothetical protein
MGHANAAITLGVCAHLIGDEDTGAASVADKMLTR